MSQGVSPCQDVFLLDVPDLNDLLEPIGAYNLLYQILRFKKYIFLKESDVHINLMPFDDGSAYVELIRKKDNRILEWAYIDAHDC